MESATHMTRRLDIDAMTGDTCVQEVTKALKGVIGVTTQSVGVGSATIGADQPGCDAACAAVTGAGYKCREAGRSNGMNGPSRAPQAAPFALKNGNQAQNLAGNDAPATRAPATTS